MSFAQQADLKKDKKLNVGFNAKIIHRKAGEFATAWGFGFDGGVQFTADRFKLGIVARDITTTFNAWSFNFSERVREVFYVTKNDIPVKSTELTAPKLIAGGAYSFRLNKTMNLLTEANFDFTFDGRRNTVLGSNIVSVDPKLGLELSLKEIFFVRAGINNFQRALDDADSTYQKKIWIYQPALEQVLRFPMCK